ERLWKQTAFINSIMCFLAFTAVTEGKTYETAEPIIWRKTPHRISRGHFYATIILDIQNPCDVLDQLFNDSFDVRTWCNSTYQKAVTEPLTKYCPRVKKVKLMNPYKDRGMGRKNKVGKSRPERELIILGIVAMITIVGTVAF